MAEISKLQRELYTVAEAARLLSLRSSGARVTTQTLKRWLEGYQRNNVTYPPVLREKPIGRDVVTWAEFVEAGLLAQYRNRQVPLQKLRPMIEKLRSEFGVPYPLAHFKPLIDPGELELVFKLQEELGLDRALWFVVRDGFQGVLEIDELAEKYFQKIDFDDANRPERIRPLGAGTSVVIDPDRSFGAPSVRGIRTEVLFDLFQAGESMETIARDYDLTVENVQEAIRFESGSRAA